MTEKYATNIEEKIIREIITIVEELAEKKRLENKARISNQPPINSRLIESYESYCSMGTGLINALIKKYDFSPKELNFKKLTE